MVLWSAVVLFGLLRSNVSVVFDSSLNGIEFEVFFVVLILYWLYF